MQTRAMHGNAKTVRVLNVLTGIQPGSAVASFSYDAFSEWGLLPANQALPVPDIRPEVVALLTSGLTASIGEAQAKASMH